MADPSEPEQPLLSRVVRHILQSMGAKKYEPRVVEQLIEFHHSFTSQVLEDAREYAKHADRAVCGDIVPRQFVVLTLFAHRSLK
jgi:histone H3/H4